MAMMSDSKGGFRGFQMPQTSPQFSMPTVQPQASPIGSPAVMPPAPQISGLPFSPDMPQLPPVSPIPEHRMSRDPIIGDWGSNGGVARLPKPEISRPTEQVAFNNPEWHRQNPYYHNEGSHTNWRATPLDQRKSAVQAAPAPSPLPAPGPTRYQQMAQAINQRALARGGR